MNSFLILIDQVIDIYIFILFINIIVSWLIAFEVVNPYNKLVTTIYFASKKLTDPLLNPIRNILPNLGGINISPIIIILLLPFFRNILFEYLAQPLHLII